MLKKIIATLLMLTLLSSPFLLQTVSADTKTDEYKRQISELQEKEKKYSSQLAAAKSKIKDKEAYRETLVEQIGVLSKEISTFHSQIAELNTDIAAKQKKIKAAKKKIEVQMNTLKKRVRTIYMAGQASDLEIILGAKDFSDFLDKYELVKTLSDYDEKLINSIQTQLDTITEEKQALVEQKAVLEESEKALEKKQSKLTTLLNENEAVLAELYNDKNDAEKMMNNASAQESEIQKQLDAYNKRLEAQRAAQLAAQNNNNANSNNPAPASINVTASGMTWPVPGYYYVISPFAENRGYSHKGVDITGGGIMGATVVASSGGTVIASNNSCSHNWGKNGSCGCGGGYGNYVLIDHGNGKTTLYGHLSSAVVSSGASVGKGQTIGYVGSTGWSSGAHLHFETRSGGAVYNPMIEF
ncbi:MAG: peptidoglycan DD-metalloendopeptidase family protein [Ruminococcus sp.]|nr:peptidoglycan DD-metalloendopeptidase family protein [Ruminococcus sp.]